MSNLGSELNHVPDQLVEQLVKGYDALSVEIKALDEQRRELENRLGWAKQQYLAALKRFTPESSSPDFRTFLDELDEAGACEPENYVDWLASARTSNDLNRQKRAYAIQSAADAREKISYRRRASDAGHGVKIWNGKSADAPELERDFTTYGGRTGRLRCPFVAPEKRGNHSTSNGGANGTAVVMTNGMNGHRTPRGSSSILSGRRSKRSSFHDPIRAEICGYDPAASTPPSVEGSAPLCPIRFLDQHSPEEVAQYFEKHKHELPRSHEICVKRYQANETSIRELDAKYGNLISMIQGLGVVHQPLLRDPPDEEEAEDEAVEPGTRNRVEQWAESLVGAEEVLVSPTAAEHGDGDEERQPHFDRPLKDVRLGESPSRPWGIPVPQDETHIGVAKSDHTASPRDSPALQLPGDDQVNEGAKPKCPFDHTKMGMMAGGMPPGIMGGLPPGMARTKPAPKSSLMPEVGDVPPSATKKVPHHELLKAAPPPSQMVFNGPVFFGYNAEQVVAMLRESNLGK